MKVLLQFFRGWLGMYLVLVHFVVPFYLVASYPKVPQPAVRFMRGLGYGVVEGPPSELGFWYRFLGCGAWVLLGMLVLWHRVRKEGEKHPSKVQKVRSKRRAT